MTTARFQLHAPFIFVSLIVVACFAAGSRAAESPIPVPIDAAMRNPWPPAWEKEFTRRGEAVLKAQCAQQKAQGLGGRTYFESEKRAYGILMAHAVAGDRAAAIKELQREDAQAEAWHKHTNGIDFYACFTLKHQTRKYFLFGDQFEPAYRQRMLEGAKVWTEQDPLRRPHYAFKQRGPGWGPDVMNSWVDVRSTENLFLMRVTSVYLFAEEAGNEAMRKQYKTILLDYAKSLYRVGMGEWDSENYHGHSMGPLLNLHDFAKDPQVKAAAKACLDYMCAVGAVKYFRGAFNGPTNRDYNHPQPFGGSAACMLWLYFGDAATDNTHFESDEVHVFTSSYRPPAAVVHLARKNFDRPAEVFASKPHYTASTTGDFKSPPDQLETQFFGRTFQMGSLIGGTTAGKSAINGFKITLADDKAGALAIQGVPGPDPRYVGSARYVEGKVAGVNRVAQNRNLALWLVAGGDAPWVWTIPSSIAVEEEAGVTFLRGDRTWIALRPVNTGALRIDEDLAKKPGDNSEKDPLWPGHRVVAAKGLGGKYCGLAIEVGEAPDHADYAAFKKAVLAKAKVDAKRIDAGVASFTGANGHTIQMQFGATTSETEVWRDGVKIDWTQHARHAFRSGDKGTIEQPWLGGKLTVRAGGATFTGAVDDHGNATFRND